MFDLRRILRHRWPFDDLTPAQRGKAARDQAAARQNARHKAALDDLHRQQAELRAITRLEPTMDRIRETRDG